jgi:phage/plasmid-like protein (TIGR03299 family)
MTTDVNAAFDATRAAQIEQQANRAADFEQRVKDGKMANLGGGRYQVRDPGSWDNGEVFYLSQGILVPQHGLNVQDGKVALYSAHPEWHELGSIIPGGTTDIEQVLELGGVNFGVEQRDLRFYAGGELRQVPGFKVNFRDDTFDTFGVVGSVYKVNQPRKSFEWLQDLVGKYDVVWESAGLTAKNKLFVCVRLPQDVELDIPGLDAAEIIRPYVVVFDSWDGNSKFETKVTPWRVRCGNTERFATRDAVSSWGTRHTTNATQRMEEARRTLGLSLKYLETFKAEEERLARVNLEIDGFRDLMNHLWVPPGDPDDITRRQANYIAERTEALEGMWTVQARETGRTAYSAERTVTDYLDHVAPRRVVGDKLAAARATAALEGADDDIKSKAHRKLLTLTNR